MRIPSIHRWALVCILASSAVWAAGWPEWRGEGRRGEWTESGVLESFPPAGLKVRWRVPVHAGYSGPAVSAGRVYVTDFRRTGMGRGVERILCLDEKTGRELWTREWEAAYGGQSRTYAIGPRATPTVDGDRVYVLGASGILLCLRTTDGSVVWRKDYQKDHGANMPVYGFSGAPLVDGGRLICLVGGEPGGKVIAFDKMTGAEIWRALSGRTQTGYSQPVIIRAGGARQLIVWHPQALSSLNPATGEVYWEQPFRVQLGVSVATPVRSGSRLLISSEFDGSMLMELDRGKPAAKMLWREERNSSIRTTGLHSLISTPVILGDYIYGICIYGELRCLRAGDGGRVWETLDVIGERAHWAAGFLVKNGDRFFINNDAGELIIAKLSPEKYTEIDRTQLIKPTSNPGNRRKAGGVNWSHPAYANRHIFARNDEELLCASLEAR